MHILREKRQNTEFFLVRIWENTDQIIVIENHFLVHILQINIRVINLTPLNVKKKEKYLDIVIIESYNKIKEIDINDILPDRTIQEKEFVSNGK